MRLARLWFAVTVVQSATVARAQTIRGIVIDSASRQPVPGVVVSLLDSNAALLGRIITNDRGQFNVPQASGIRRLRAQRIGFRRREIPVDVALTGFTSVELRITALPTLLEPVFSTSNSKCRRRGDERATFGLLEQARSGVLATVVSRGRDTAAMRVLVFERVLGTDDRIVSQDVRYDSATTFLPFAASKSPGDFVRTGFVRETSTGMEFYAPDADVLLSNDFTEGYCFRIADADRRRPDQIGLGFDPAERPRGRQAISGVLWIDTVQRALVDLEYRYLDLGRLANVAQPGGRVSFVEARPGVALIDRWSLRLPRQRADTTRDYQNVATVRSWYEPVETGAELALSRWDDAREWRGQFGKLRVTVLADSAPAAGRTFRLDNSDYRATTDSTGALLIPELLPGPYTLIPVDTTLAKVGLTFPAVFHFIAARDATVLARIEAPTLEGYARDHCVTGTTPAGAPVQHLVVGRVIHADGKPVAGAAIKAKWFGESNYFIGDPKPVKTEPDGYFVLCLPERAKDATFTVVVRTTIGETIVSARAATVVTPLPIVVDKPPQ